MVRCWKSYITGVMKSGWLWLPVSPATDVRRGQIRANFFRLDQFYWIPKYRMSGTSVRVFPRHLKLLQSSKFRPAISALKQLKSCWEFVLLRSILHAELPDLVETSFVGQSYIYLEFLLTEFFCNLSAVIIRWARPFLPSPLWGDPLHCGARRDHFFTHKIILGPVARRPLRQCVHR